ncbi:exoenzyme S synthesis protein B [Alcanivorax hongdengensis A-11-3]|uniref:7-cyano-7-deazaguanine synthase n=1 Tax=Alcanivorax hongdengensis A-11-3 TaxID=1177179 RepID=L0WDX4_9GAMM|nr:7-cyano-7-deazaguanine synthase QueC [Alcanivorax hongdengensis]EKF73995.1 exoenzyme S synthesis protein B [Alcanivorax hongdengensis A-11-3]
MKKAVVLLSGGLDSATCLAIARDQGYQCHTIAFDYGQRTRSELDAAARVSEALGAASHRVIELGMGNIGGSALTDHNIEVPEDGGEGIPVTYVPARNTVFLSLALGLAEVTGAEAIYIGVNAVDYSGYPDCRPAFIEAFQTLANLATKAGVEGNTIRIETPLMHLSKAQIIQQGEGLGLDYGLTVSCYQADAEGRACGRCDSCRLRKQGFADALVKDPTNYQ